MILGSSTLQSLGIVSLLGSSHIIIELPQIILGSSLLLSLGVGSSGSLGSSLVGRRSILMPVTLLLVPETTGKIREGYRCASDG